MYDRLLGCSTHFGDQFIFQNNFIPLHNGCGHNITQTELSALYPLVFLAVKTAGNRGLELDRVAGLHILFSFFGH